MTAGSEFSVKNAAALREQPPEYQDLVRKIIVSHALNELTGATVFDEPAIAFAPTPYWKWLTCRIAMEEYGHHVRFAKMGREIGVPEEAMLPDRTDKKPLSLFDFPLAGWETFCVIKMLGDMAEILQVEDLLGCSYVPLRAAAKATMPEEQFHAKFGEKACTEIARTDGGPERLQAAIDTIFPILPAFFGRTGSKNNELYRKWGIKARTNEGMRADHFERSRVLVEDKLGLKLPQPSPPAP